MCSVIEDEKLQKCINLICPHYAQQLALCKKTKILENAHKELVCQRMFQQPLVSFVFPVFNRAFVLKEFINALYKQNVSFPFEIIALDNYSCDNTANLLARYAVEHKNFFVYYCDSHEDSWSLLNKGIACAAGIYICPVFIDKICSFLIENVINTMVKQNMTAAFLRKIKFYRNFDFEHELKCVTLFPDTSKVDLIDLITSQQAHLVDYSVMIFKKSAWLAVGGFFVERGFNMWGFLFKLAANGYDISLLDDTVSYRLWKDTWNILPLWDYDLRYGRIKPPLCKGICQLMSENKEFFEHNMPLDLVMKYQKSSDILSLNKFISQFLLNDNIVQMLSKARFYYLEGDFLRSVNLFEQVFASGVQHPIILLFIALNYCALGKQQKADKALDQLAYLTGKI